VCTNTTNRVSADFTLIIQHPVPEGIHRQKHHMKISLILKFFTDMHINFRLPETAVFPITRVFLQICNEGKYITEIKI
jgi:hypothetical protein